MESGAVVPADVVRSSSREDGDVIDAKVGADAAVGASVATGAVSSGSDLTKVKEQTGAAQQVLGTDSADS